MSDLMNFVYDTNLRVLTLFASGVTIFTVVSYMLYKMPPKSPLGMSIIEFLLSIVVFFTKVFMYIYLVMGVLIILNMCEVIR